jgi:HTH domain
VGTSARLLKLLSLLARRGWSGVGLAARLEVTERTVWRAWWSRAAGRTTAGRATAGHLAAGISGDYASRGS